MRMRPIHDAVALLARTGVGAVFVVHGWKKIQAGVDATGRDFHTLHVPLPTAAAVYSTFVELLGGAALILGLGLPIVGVLLFLDMAGALVFVNGSHGLLVSGHGGIGHQGFEYVLVLGLASLLFAVGGAGGFTLDRRLVGRRHARVEDEETDQWLDTLHNRPQAEVTEKRPRKMIGRRGSRKERRTAREERRTAEEEPPPWREVPAGTETTVPTPRLVTEIVEDPNHDVLVARPRPAEQTPPEEAEDSAD